MPTMLKGTGAVNGKPERQLVRRQRQPRQDFPRQDRAVRRRWGCQPQARTAGRDGAPGCKESADSRAAGSMLRKHMPRAASTTVTGRPSSTQTKGAPPSKQFWHLRQSQHMRRPPATGMMRRCRSEWRVPCSQQLSSKPVRWTPLRRVFARSFHPSLAAALYPDAVLKDELRHLEKTCPAVVFGFKRATAALRLCLLPPMWK